MIRNLFYFFIVVLLLQSSSFSQNHEDFFVVNVKGKITKRSGNQNWQNVKCNDLLKRNDFISIGDKSFLNVYDDRSKQYFVIHGIRSFTLNDLIDNKIDSETKPVNNVFVKAFENLANAFSNLNDKLSIKEIFRSSQSSQDIVAIMPRNTKVFGDDILFEWIAKDTLTTVQFLLLDENLNLILDTLIYKKSSFLLQSKLEPGKEYVWQLSYENSRKKVINYFSTADQDDLTLLMNRLDSLSIYFPSLKTPNYFVMKGLISEEGGYRFSAYCSYKQAFFLSGCDEKYGKIIEDYFNRQKMNLKFKDILSYK